MKEFIQALPEKEKNILISKIYSIAENCPPHNREKFRNEGDNIYAIKQNQIRVYCFFDQGKMIILTHGFMKNSRKADPEQLIKAKKIREKYLAEKGEPGSPKSQKRG